MNIPRHWHCNAALAVMVLLGCGFAPASLAGSSNVCSTVTAPVVCFEGTQITVPPSGGGAAVPLQGNVDRMISYRHQQHSWQTADGYLHITANLGIPFYNGGNGLALFSSPDNGQTWKTDLTFPSTGTFTTADGLLVGNSLVLAYSGSDVGGNIEGGSIFYSVLNYDTTLHTWSLIGTTTVYDASSNSASYAALNPAIAIDSQNRVWCSYVRETREVYGTQPYPVSNIRLSVGTTAAPASQSQPSWHDTDLTFGSTGNQTVDVERSARPLVIQNGIGMIYTVHQSLFWTFRYDNWPLTQKWTAPTDIFTGAPPYDNNPYSSHFSEVKDSSGNIHLAAVDHQRLLYTRYSATHHYWSQPQVIMPANNPDGSPTFATYPKISLVQGSRLEIFVNDQEVVRGYESRDGGNTFAYSYLLAHDNVTSAGDPNNGTDGFANPRVELPAAWSSSALPIVLPVVQQYEDGPSGAPPNFNLQLNNTINHVMGFQLTLAN